MKRTIMAMLASIGLAIAATFAGAIPAQADALKCSLSHEDAHTCLSVHASGLYVRYVGVDHTHIVKGIFTICNSAGSFTGTLKNGKRYNYTTPSLGGCNFFGQIVGPINIYQDFKNGTTFTGQNWHDGKWSPGVPVATIHS